MKTVLTDTGVLLCSFGDVPQVCELLGVSHTFLKGGEPEEISDISRKTFVSTNSAEKPDWEQKNKGVFFFVDLN